MEGQEEKKPAERVDIALLQELNAVCEKLGVTLLGYQLESHLLDVRVVLDS